MKKSTLPLPADELAADARKKKPKITLAAVTALASAMEKLNQQYEDKLIEAALIKELYNEIAMKDLPEAMQMLKIKHLGMESGNEIIIQEIISCRITKEKQQQAHEWLRKNQHSDLIKNEISIMFGKGEEVDADTLMDTIETSAINFTTLTREETVHPQTLKAFIAEQIHSPEAKLPLELFGVNIVNIAQINKPKKKKI